MTIADNLKVLAHSIRAIPGRMGIRVHSIQLVISDWSGLHSGDGTRTDSFTKILETGQNPKVAWMTDEERALADLSSGSVKIGPITADHGAVSRLSLIRGKDLQDTDARYIKITGPKHPNGASYRIKTLITHKAIHYFIIASPAEVKS